MVEALGSGPLQVEGGVPRAGEVGDHSPARTGHVRQHLQLVGAPPLMAGGEGLHPDRVFGVGI